MYLKIYSIGKVTNDANNPKFPNFEQIYLLRFSKMQIQSPGIIYNDENDNKVTKLYNELVLNAILHEKCFNLIYPWNTNIRDSEEHIIAYNYVTYKILGWCTVEFSQINSADTERNSKLKKEYYTAHIQKIVTLPQKQFRTDDENIDKINFPKYIGKIILLFIYETFMVNNTKIMLNITRFNHKTNQHETKPEANKINYLYLYALTTAIDFYKNNIDFLQQLYNPEIDNEQQDIIYQHVFYAYNNDDLLGERRLRLKNSYDATYELHPFEINSDMDQETRDVYIAFNAPPECYDRFIDTSNNNVFVNLYESNTNKEIEKYIPERFILYGNTASQVSKKQRIRGGYRY